MISGGSGQRILVAPIDGAKGADAVASLAAIEAAETDGAAVVIEVTRDRGRPATLVAPNSAKELEALLSPVDPELTVRARGKLCFVAVPDDDQAAGRVVAVLAALSPGIPVVVLVPPERYREVLELEAAEFGRVIFRADLKDRPSGDELEAAVAPDRGDRGGPGDDDCVAAVVELAVAEAREFADSVEVVNRRPGRLASRRALAGTGSPVLGRRGNVRSEIAADGGQATPLVLGAIFVLVLGTIALVAIAGAITGKARAQSVADLSALSAARSMKDDLPRLLAPPTLPNGLPNPAHMSKFEYLTRARVTAVTIAMKNGASPLRVAVRFPDSYSYAPVRTRVTVRSRVLSGRPGKMTSDWAEARIGAPVSMGAVPAMASGGGYSGPLAERQGKGLRPDVAAAFDRMAAAASAAGVVLSINSAFRSDAEQAALFAANPDPTWVARPGTSLHRCATELDLGPPSATGWLAANAGRFGFVQRYSWESWHFGFTAGPAPCSEAGNRVAAGGGGRGDGSPSLTGSLPAFVPARFRKPILAAAMKWNVSAALLAAQLYAESGFDPSAGSSAGAQGIAQFMPATAATYGLANPLDPIAAIDAQGHLMSDLLKEFGGSPALALAAYNAGPGAVSPCNCIPDYPETQAYVAKILAMLGGVGAISPMPMEVELAR